MCRAFLAFALACAAAAHAQPVIDATITTLTNFTAPEGIALSNDGALLYVAQGAAPTLSWSPSQGCTGSSESGNVGSVAIVDTASRSRVAQFTEVGRPIHAELDASTGRVYVAVSPVGVSVYQGSTRLSAATPMGGAPHDVGIDAPLGTGLVTNTVDVSGSASAQTWVSLIELATGRTIQNSNTGTFGPHKAAVDPARHLAYVSHAVAPTVDVVDMRTGIVLRQIATGLTAGGAQNAIDLVRRRLYVDGDTGSANGKVVVIDLASEQPIATVTLPYPHSLRVDAATGLVWVPLAEAGANAAAGGMVAVIDPDSLTERARMRVGHCPYYLDFDASRRIAYVTNEADGSVTLVDMTRVPAGAAADRVFNWAEVNYPQYFPVRYALSRTGLGYYYRYYPQTNIYVGTANERMYVYGPSTWGANIIDIGPLADWVARAQAGGF